MADLDYIPHVGDKLEGPAIEMLVEAIERRKRNFPEEPFDITLALIMLNIGSRFTPLECVGKEWRGFKKDLSYSLHAPTCPNGHAIEKGPAITLGWVLENE